MTATNGITLRVTDLKKYYGKIHAVDGVSFTIPSGSVFTILGPNGAGKTTTLEILEGIRVPDAGEIEVFGVRVKQIDQQTAHPELERRIGVASRHEYVVEFACRKRPQADPDRDVGEDPFVDPHERPVPRDNPDRQRQDEQQPGRKPRCLQKRTGSFRCGRVHGVLTGSLTLTFYILAHGVALLKK